MEPKPLAHCLQKYLHLYHILIVVQIWTLTLMMFSVLLQIPLWKQKSGHGNEPVLWDYHVILLQVRPQSESLVYDLDSELSFPCSLRLYGAMAFRSDRHIRPEYHRKLRVIPAESFMLNFASDRSHMRNPDGTWKMPPPPYPALQTAECQMNLDDFISMNPAVGWGTVYSLDQFLHTYTGNPSTTLICSSLS
uniref:Protein N-terminal glutamine amidohydrolase n=1 Tax=Fundulus heteroclitus TaxID=8078 RepID=A0A3Q2R378_FUNHE